MPDFQFFHYFILINGLPKFRFCYKDLNFKNPSISDFAEFKYLEKATTYMAVTHQKFSAMWYRTQNKS